MQFPSVKTAPLHPQKSSRKRTPKSGFEPDQIPNPTLLSSPPRAERSHSLPPHQHSCVYPTPHGAPFNPSINSRPWKFKKQLLQKNVGTNLTHYIEGALYRDSTVLSKLIAPRLFEICSAVVMINGPLSFKHFENP